MAEIGNLARYREISRLGSGGMATVVLAEDTMLGRLVALKRMHRDGDVRALSRLRREALVGASLSHPNLVPIYDVLDAGNGEHVIVMEYVAGETLRDALRRGSGLSVTASLRVLEGVGAALDAIHRRGIVHRDVKPANILLGADGAIKLADLGIASASDRTQITTDGAVLGTFSYMAPEQLGGAPSTAAVDVYALSAVAFEMLAGRKARPEPNPLALAHALSTQPPPDLHETWPQAPRSAAELLVRGMARDPSQRPRSATELTGRLRAALEPHTTASMPVPDVASPPTRPGSAPAPKAAAPVPAARAARAPAARAAPVPAAKATRAPAPGAARVPAPGAARVPATGAARVPAPGADTGDRGRARPQRRSLAAALIALAAVAVVIAVALSGSSSPPRRPTHATAGQRSASGAGRQPATAKAGPTTGGGANGAARTAQNPTATAANGSPVAAVESFYGLAASHRYSAAWALADPTLRSQLGGYQSFQAGQAGDRSITFGVAHVVSRSRGGATVAVQTTSTRTDGTHHCVGSVDLLPGDLAGSWRLHLLHINCT